MSGSYALAAAICDALARSAATTRAGRIAVVRRVLDSAGGSEDAQPHGGRASFDSEPPAEASARHPTIAEMQEWAEAAVDRASAASRPAARVEGPQPLAAGDGGLEADRRHGPAPTAQTANAARGSSEPPPVRPRGAKSAKRVGRGGEPIGETEGGISRDGGLKSSAKAATTRPEWAIRDAIARGL